ncbi:hypothetical protein MKW94_007777 [Papaver nudicaule]|uniref:Ribosomal RNA-processing protein 14/surfeit locus protein 6 C-terminal domain-containing protein n=1 Tax=Papaver nudicaule TaxID=74823 RepID=A0AA42AYM7_PAPNU|nr:hypothetical protein [Papaver nudicaule]
MYCDKTRNPKLNFVSSVSVSVAAVLNQMNKKEKISKFVITNGDLKSIIKDHFTDGDLKSIIKDHSKFFDKLVDLIPAKFYLPAEEKPWFQGLKSKENLKKARRNKLDPEEPSGTLDLLKKKVVEDNEDSEESEDDDIEVSDESDEEEEDKKDVLKLKMKDEEESLTYEELRGKLSRKLVELRSGRKAGPEEESNREKKRNEWFKKRKRENDGEIETKAEIKMKKIEDNIIQTQKKIKEDISKAVDELTFGHVKIDENDEFGKKKKKRKLSKSQALEEARKIQEAKKDPEKGESIAKKHSIRAATDRAAGIKVHDDPKLINKSIKKEKKKQQKSAKKWKDRDETKNKVRAEKQKARNDNIQGRIQAKKAKKIEKREKKLMRPGFEGRKQGFINEPAKN